MMTTTAAPDRARRLAAARYRQELAELDYRRELAEAAAEGMTQKEMARALGISQPSVSSALHHAENTPARRQGFSGAGPYEICKRYAAGLIDRDQLLDELTRWPYAPMARTDGIDNILVDPPGSAGELVDAEVAGLIDLDLYGELVGRISPVAR